MYKCIYFKVFKVKFTWNANYRVFFVHFIFILKQLSFNLSIKYQNYKIKYSVSYTRNKHWKPLARGNFCWHLQTGMRP